MVFKTLVPEVKDAIVRAKEGGATDREVARLFSTDHTTVSRVYKRYKDSNSTARLPGSGRPRKSSEKDDRALVRIVKKDPLKTATDLTKHANERLGLGISTRTARRILK